MTLRHHAALAWLGLALASLDADAAASIVPTPWASHARCAVDATARDRAMLDTSAIAKGAATSSTIFVDGFETRPATRIVLHVLEGAGGSGALTQAQIDAQLLVLNDAFATTRFRFELAQVKRYPDSFYFQRCYPTLQEGQTMKRELAIDPAGNINVYSCELLFPFIAGSATFPHSFPENDPQHGVNVDYRTFPGGTWAPYDMGATLVHEIGHYLGLFHTFQGGCGQPGDEVDDTPAEANAAGGCPIGRDTCPAPGADAVTNYMNYSDDACMENFTAGQARRMETLSNAFRPGL